MKRKFSDLPAGQTSQFVLNWLPNQSQLPAFGCDKRLRALVASPGPAPGTLVPHQFPLEIRLGTGRKVWVRIFLIYAMSPLGLPFNSSLVRIGFLCRLDTKALHPNKIPEKDYPEFDHSEVLEQIKQEFILDGFVHPKKGRFYSEQERPALPVKKKPAVDFGRLADEVRREASLSNVGGRSRSGKVVFSDATGRAMCRRVR